MARVQRGPQPPPLVGSPRSQARDNRKTGHDGREKKRFVIVAAPLLRILEQNAPLRNGP
jgi:hypothetical protein